MSNYTITNSDPETPNICDQCAERFFYDPKHHRCPGEWEAIAGPAPASPYAGMSWVDECMAKQR